MHLRYFPMKQLSVSLFSQASQVQILVLIKNSSKQTRYERQNTALLHQSVQIIREKHCESGPDLIFSNTGHLMKVNILSVMSN